MLNGETVIRSKSRKYFIFMFLIFVVSTLMILLWAYNIYQKGVIATTGEEQESSNCWSYVYEIKDIQYNDNTLTFNLENKFYSDARISKINIVTSDEKREQDFPGIAKGTTRLIKIEDIKIENSFLAYPDNCVNLAKEYMVS